MSAFRSHFVAVAGHELHVSEWGDTAAPALVMWHGLARTGRDFDWVATHFATRYRVLCPDTIGRGLSTWSRDPDVEYTVPFYCDLALGLLDAFGIANCRWVGTSMGGLIGMALAGSEAGGARIDKLVLNDIGPELNVEAVNRIKAYVSLVPEFATMAEFEAFLRTAYAPFGALSDAQWRHLAQTSVRRRDNGKLSSHFDPEVMRVFCEQFSHFSAWELWDAITCPTLLLRGEVSDLLLPATAEEMTKRGPKARLITVPGVGHAPMFTGPEQWLPLEAFLA